MRKTKEAISFVISEVPIIRVTGNYQVTIPTEIRKAIQVNKGDYVEMTLEADGVFLRPVEMIPRVSQSKSKKNAWEKSTQAQFLKGYAEEDSIYDNL